ncbi:hypothetical protein TSAR_011365 [Trichomalopsis sarcophagae]|uniref:Uncharacterized protein n=1 Tax=Trichomalopsis sarcophagae TaxID=543379 RepID=A0A232EV44_9HYME|nr:hypothetical protein TSAR_011365 [Trichomalopsis sarcophagae]
MAADQLQLNFSTTRRAWSICLIVLRHLVDSRQDQGKNLSHALNRHIRSLIFPNSSNMGIFFAISIPIDIPDKSVALSWYFEANYGLLSINDSVVSLPFFRHQRSEPSCCSRRRSIDRQMLYDLLQSRLESNGYPGRACLLRTICESARFPFGLSGLVGDITRIIFTPSASRREEHLDVEFEEAENAADCSKFSENCETSLLESISRSFESELPVVSPGLGVVRRVGSWWEQ